MLHVKIHLASRRNRYQMTRGALGRFGAIWPSSSSRERTGTTPPIEDSSQWLLIGIDFNTKQAWDLSNRRRERILVLWPILDLLIVEFRWIFEKMNDRWNEDGLGTVG